MTARAEALGGPLVTPVMRLLVAIFGIGVALIAWRLLAGLGATTALNDGYPLGLWIAFDVVTGTALACGGYAVAIMVYLLNRGQYHPLVRPALLTSALGYSLAGASVLLDVGRWWLIWKVPVYVWHWNFNSVLLEVALCIMAYVVVLWIELAPAFLERAQESGPVALRRLADVTLPVLNKALPWIIALGILLPTMHQSSLGTLMLLAGSRLHPLWRSPMMPLLFLTTCVSMGFAVVVFEAAFSTTAAHRRVDTMLLGSLAGAMVPIMSFTLVLRLADWAWRGVLGELRAGDVRSVMALVEIGLFVLPILMLLPRRRRTNIGDLVRASLVMMFAGAVFRFDMYLVAFMPGENWSYFPNVPELLITVGLVAAEVAAYIAIVKIFPILGAEQPRAVTRVA